MKICKKVIMIDAGTVLFESKDGYGTVLGQMKAEMDEFGSTLGRESLETEDLPPVCRDCDLFMDFSTPGRYRYISCKVEDAGDTGRRTQDGEPIRRYAVSFMEGSATLWPRTVLLLLIAALLLRLFILLPSYLSIPLSIASVLYIIYVWLKPSRYSQKVVEKLKEVTRAKHT